MNTCDLLTEKVYRLIMYAHGAYIRFERISLKQHWQISTKPFQGSFNAHTPATTLTFEG